MPVHTELPVLGHGDPPRGRRESVNRGEGEQRRASSHCAARVAAEMTALEQAQSRSRAATPSEAGSTAAPKRKILVRKLKSSATKSDALGGTADARDAGGHRLHDHHLFQSGRAASSGAPRSTISRGSSSLASTPRHAFDFTRGFDATTSASAASSRGGPKTRADGRARSPSPPPAPATARAIAPGGPRPDARSGKRREWAVLGDVGEYERTLQKKIEQAKLEMPPTPEALPELPPHLNRAARDVNGGKFVRHYQRAFRVLTERRREAANFANQLENARVAEAAELAQKSKEDVGWELHVKMTNIAQENALNQWERRRESWEKLMRAHAAAHGKSVGDIAMARCDEWRRKNEVFAHLDMAVPIHEREGGCHWEWRMSLKNNYMRYYPVGNIFRRVLYTGPHTTASAW